MISVSSRIVCGNADPCGSAVYSPTWTLAAFALALVAGGAFGFLPASRAARLKAVDALRGKR